MLIKRKNSPPSSQGILLNSDFHVSPRNRSRLETSLIVVSQAVIILMGLIGAGYTFISTFSVPHSMAPLLLFLFTSTIIWMIILTRKRFRRILTLILLMLPLIPLYFLWPSVKDGFIVTANHMVYAINQQMNWNLYDYITLCTPDQFSYVTTIFFLFISFYLAFLLCWAIIRRHSFSIVFIATIPFLIGFLYTLIPSYVSILMLITCWMSLFAMYPLKTRRKKLESSLAFTSKTKGSRTSFILSAPDLINPVMIKSGAVLICCTLLCIGLLFLCFPKDHYKRSDRVTQLQYDMIDGIRNFSISGQVSMTGLGGISGGDLSKLGDLTFLHSPALKISTDCPDPMYLRGWIGGEYTGNEWKNSDSLSEEYQYQMSGYSSWIPQYQTSKFLSLFGDTLNSPNYRYRGQLDYLNVQKQYVYTPYTVRSITSSDRFRFENDRGIQVSDTLSEESYQLEFSAPHDNSFYYWDSSQWELFTPRYYNHPDTSIPGLTEYLREERTYQLFVNDVYTQLPEESRRSAEQFFIESGLNFEPISQEYRSRDMQTIITAITNYLKQNYEYTLSPGSTPKGEDFVDYFLFQSKRGYCSHFASATTVLLRSLDIPARYVEGYVATQNDLDKATPGENYRYEYNINDTNAHAWVEVYQNGVGWVPFETTPGYSGLQRINLTGENGISGGPGGINSELTPYPDPLDESSSSSEYEASAPSSSLISPSSLSPASTITDTPEAPVSHRLNLFIIVISILLFTVFITCCILFLRRKMVLKQRSRSFHSPSLNSNARKLYQYLLSVMEQDGFPNRETSALKYAELVSKRYPFIDAEEMTYLTYVAMKTQYSQEDVTPEELDRLYRFVTRTVDQMYQSHSIWERLIFKYIHNLC